MQPDRIRVVLVDDQAMVRSGLRLILETEPDIEVVGEAANGREGLDVVRRARPDIVLIDIQMPVMDGLAALRELVARRTSSTADASDDLPRVVILTTFDLDEYVFEALRNGASGFILKNAPADELIRAVRTVAAGDALLAAPITRRVIEQFVQGRPRSLAERDLQRLSRRELEVLGLVAEGLSNKEIAERLVLGEATIKTHLGSILAKLGLRDRVAAVIVAYESGVVGHKPERR
jgi:DNA-binding NarL/FixJ family response regulator